jgi:putative sterol carrier protein
VGSRGASSTSSRGPLTEARAICWTIDVTDGRATSRPGAAADAKLTVRFQLADFIRVIAGTSDPAAALLENRASVEGDLALAARLAEMFVGESGY